MTISLTGVTVDTGVPAQNPRPLANPVISTAGNDTQAIARQQLASAVPAPALLAAYSTGVNQQPKPPAKPFSSAPSSSLAAQFIAQGVSDEDLALFTPPPPSATTEQETQAADDYLSDLRIARGDVAVKDAPAQATAKPTAPLTPEVATRSAITSFAHAVPSLFAQLFRRQTIGQVKGISAYQLAEARNATMRKVVAPAVAEAAN